MGPVAERIGNNDTYVTNINHASHFKQQAQYLLTFEDNSYCSSRI